MERHSMASGPGIVVYVHVTPPCLQLVHGSFLWYFLLFHFFRHCVQASIAPCDLAFRAPDCPVYLVAGVGKYYNLTDRSRVYRAAVALHPRLRFAYFERVWKESPDGHGEIKRARAATKLFFKAYLAKHPKPIVLSVSMSSEPVQRRSPTNED